VAVDKVLSVVGSINMMVGRPLAFWHCQYGCDELVFGMNAIVAAIPVEQ